jgi:hypothetical protein
MKSNRRSIRLPRYDYASAGWYFVTMCCHGRQHLFGNYVRANPSRQRRTRLVQFAPTSNSKSCRGIRNNLNEISGRRIKVKVHRLGFSSPSALVMPPKNPCAFSIQACLRTLENPTFNYSLHSSKPRFSIR